MAASRHIVTAAELDAMTPTERFEHFQASVILDPGNDERMTEQMWALLERVGHRARARVEQSEQ
jgi:phosphate starvation-inducible protein PhoH